MSEKLGMGWLPDLPDIRDYTVEHETVKAVLKKAGGPKTDKLPAKLAMDLRAWCSPVEDQLNLGSCTAQAGVGLMEYYQRRAKGSFINGSRLFTYKTTRNLLKWVGDTGAFCRSTMGSMVLFGVPPEEYWPYDVPKFDVEPPAFVYGLAQNFQSLQYYRLDPPGTAKLTVLNQIRSNLAAGLPCMFGFTVYNSISQAGPAGKIPFPATGDGVLGGHAVMIVGCDDAMPIQNAKIGSVRTVGAFMIRNSWGPGWGNGGYGWLPYQYLLSGLAQDFWALVSSEWVNILPFKQ